MADKQHDPEACKKTMLAVHDAMDVLGGKWKIAIVASLGFGRKRYSQVLKDVQGISGKMLSRELKDMETNLLVNRYVVDTKPVIVEYELTEYGHQLKSVIGNLADWGNAHRKKIMGKI